MLKRYLVAVMAALAVVIALLATASPANAVDATTADTQPPARVWTPRVTVDWKWLKGGWEFRFSKRETTHVAINAGACSGLLGTLAHPVARLLSTGCGFLTWYASRLLVRGRCLNAFVAFRMVSVFSVSSRAC